MENTHSPSPSAPKQHLLGSTAADITGGIVAASCWWGVLIADLSSHRGQTSIRTGILISAFVIHLILLLCFVRGSKKFALTQIITALLLPVLVLGLIFGACLLNSR